ncbi:hypothetical protein PTT_12886 [Pyrenophora teres f. teres 0-1]|uniref:Uncharacterized protein n=1 Tax=Pyrenophora teres f. teres (strain 0-1) TaxID=861557 RepID=E3RUU6_PYRTT|nr:hypothetical protein PTT_12886 [Pyrenophora teres f. teres 0-1]
MARTRACKGRPRPPGRVIRIEKRENVRRGSTVEELMLLDDGNENEREIGRVIQCSVATKWNEDNMHDANVEIKKENSDDEMVKVDKDEKEEEEEGTTPKPLQSRKRPRTRTRIITQLSPSSSPSPSKKRKTTPLPPPRRITRSTTKPKRKVSEIEPESAFESESSSSSEKEEDSDSDSDSASSSEDDEQQITPISLLPSPFIPLSLLRTYLSFQLSLSNLSGVKYSKAEKSMKAVLDTVSSMQTSSDIRKQGMSRDNKRKIGKGRKARPKAKEREDDVLPRKRQELNEQTRRRLLVETEEVQEKKRGRGIRQSRHHSSDISSPSPEPTLLTAPTPPTRPRHSASSLSSGYTPQRTSSCTDSAASSSSAEESDVIERRERNALRRRKRAMQRKKTRLNRRPREKEDEEKGVKKEPESDDKMEVRQDMMAMVSRNRERTPAMFQTEKPVMVTFNPVAW